MSKRDATSQRYYDDEIADDNDAQVVEEESHMRLSHEIIVLDYGDERSSPYDQEKKVDKKMRNGNSKIFLSLTKRSSLGCADNP